MQLTKTNLVFDLDNTLCNCSVFYKQKQNEFARYQAQRTGHTEDFCLELLRKIDVTFTATPEGFSKHRFPRAFAATSSTLDIMMGNSIDEPAAQHSWYIGDSVFNEPYELFDGVRDMLEQYKAGGYRLFLLTKGDYDVQISKVINNKLDVIFDRDKIYVVPKKTSTELAQILYDHNLIVDETVMIGDSMRDDIGSAQALGVDSILVEDATGTWDYETITVTASRKIKHTIELPEIIPVNISF
jgi:FMN phosphatase YigB (HAD superfamily)